GGKTEPKAMREEGRPGLRVLERGELCKPYPVGIMVEEAAPRLNGEPRLADAARPGERHQPMAAQPRLDLGEVGFASDQTGQLLGKIVDRCTGSVKHPRPPAPGLLP